MTSVVVAEIAGGGVAVAVVMFFTHNSALAYLLVVRSRVGVLSGGTGRLFAVEARGAIGFSG
jgi:hypothetical protein